MKCMKSKSWLANPNQSHNRFPPNFRVSYEHLSIIKVKFSCLLEGHIGPPQRKRKGKKSWVFNLVNGYHFLNTQCSLFQDHLLLVSILGATLNLIPLKHRFPNKEKVTKKMIIYLDFCRFVTDPSQDDTVLVSSLHQWHRATSCCQVYLPPLFVGNKIWNARFFSNWRLSFSHARELKKLGNDLKSKTLFHVAL